MIVSTRWTVIGELAVTEKINLYACNAGGPLHWNNVRQDDGKLDEISIVGIILLVPNR